MSKLSEKKRGCYWCRFRKKLFCKKCAYACDCQSYENYLNTRISKLRELYWKVCAEISAWLNLISSAFENWKEHQADTKEKY